jgi:hypothetical protein
MLDVHSIEQVVERLTILAVRYPGEARRQDPGGLLGEELLSVVGRVKEFSLDGQSLNRLIFTPLEGKLLSRCGSEAGPRLYRQIVGAFRDQESGPARRRH